jgi:hypothetical protein
MWARSVVTNSNNVVLETDFSVSNANSSKYIHIKNVKAKDLKSDACRILFLR